MDSTTRRRLPSHLQDLAALAALLERMDRQPLQASASQYRDVAQRVSTLLAGATASAELDAVLQAFPAAAELYENLRYAHAGLCRMPLEQALNAELKAASAINQARLGR